jgi:hypothetical protein
MSAVARLVTAIVVLWPVLSSHATRGQDAARPPAERRHFVACPIVRDTSTVPCWLAEYDGELYYLGAQGSSASAFYPPQLGHEALIEGTVVDGPRICGGRPLAPVRVSVLRELTPACNTVLPAEPAFTPGPSPIAPAPKFPDSTREFVIPYDFDSDYLTLHATRVILEAVRVAKAVNAARVDVRGHRGATMLSNGQIVRERAGIGEVRATKDGGEPGRTRPVGRSDSHHLAGRARCARWRQRPSPSARHHHAERGRAGGGHSRRRVQSCLPDCLRRPVTEGARVGFRLGDPVRPPARGGCGYTAGWQVSPMPNQVNVALPWCSQKSALAAV